MFCRLLVLSANVKIHSKALMSLCIDIFYEIKVATIKIYEATILKIKATNALQFQSTFKNNGRAMTAKKPAKKCAALSQLPCEQRFLSGMAFSIYL